MATPEMRRLRGRYKLYKAGTQKVVEFLVETASNYTDISSLAMTTTETSTTLVYKTRSTITVKTRDLIGLAQTIAHAHKSGSSPPAYIPHTMTELLQEVIRGRELCAEFYAEHRSTQADANRKHVFFIDVLREVYRLLNCSRAPSREEKTASSVQSPEPHLEDAAANMANIFSCLDLEEPTELPLGSEPTPHDPTSPPPSSTRVIFQDDDEEKAAFALWCHLEDLRELRRFVGTTWQEYARGDISLLACTMVSETAFSLMRIANDELVSRHARFDSWEKVLRFLGLCCTHRLGDKNGLLWRRTCLYPTEPQNTHRDFKQGGELLDLLNPFAASLLQDVLKATKEVDQTRTSDSDPLIVIETDMFDFASVLHYLIHNISTTVKTFAGVPGGSPRHSHQRTEFPCGMTDYHQSGVLSLWMISAAQTYCDVYEVIGSTAGCASEAYMEGAKALERNLKPFRDFGDRWKYISQANWADRLDSAISLSNTVQENVRVTATIFDFTLKTWGRNHPQTKMTQSSLGKPLASMVGLPCSSGNLLYGIKMRFHLVGAEFANAGGMMVGMAHLYNACRKFELLKAPWHDMDLILAIQNTKTPLISKTTSAAGPGTLLRQYLIALGVSAGEFNNGRTPPCPTLCAVYSFARKTEVTSDFLNGMLEKFASKKASSSGKGEILDVILRQLAHKQDGDVSTIPSKKSKHKVKREKELTMAELLKTFKTDFIKYEPHLNFDYFGFWMFCESIHHALCEHFSQVSMRTKHSQRLMPYQSVYNILEDTAKMVLRSTPLSSTPLAEVAEVLQGFVDERGNQFSKEAFKQSSGRIPSEMRPKLRQYSCRSKSEKFRFLAAQAKEFEGVSTRLHAGGLSMYDPTGSEEVLDGTSALSQIFEELCLTIF